MVRDGVFFPTRKVGDIEARIFKSLTKTLKRSGFRYLSVPSTITRDTIDRQGVVAWENIIHVGHHHVLKKDIEVLTTTYGWMETHSCTYFGEEQTKRFGITGLTHTISNTGVASPRILVPLLERAGIPF